MVNILYNTDIMMNDNDILITESGDISLISDKSNIIQSAITNMCIIYGEMEQYPTRGNMLYQRKLKLNDNGLRTVEQDCKNAILYDERVKDVHRIIASKIPSDKYTCMVEFELTTTNGDKIGSYITINL